MSEVSAGEKINGKFQRSVDKSCIDLNSEILTYIIGQYNSSQRLRWSIG
jgi:hypothetical protein